MKLNQTGSPFNRDERNELNENWTTIENEFNNVVETVSDKAYNQVIDNVKIEWLSPVNTFNDLATTYPDIVEGKTAMVRDTGKIYRFNGIEWIEIQDIDPSAYNNMEQRISNKIGVLSDLTTTDKSSLVGAVNENTAQLAQNEKKIHDKFINALLPPPPLKGAKIDGTDTTVLVQNLLNYLRNLGGGELFFPSGTYKFTGTNVLEMNDPSYSNISITGVKGGTIFDFSDREGGANYKYFLGAFGSFENGVNLTTDVSLNSNTLSLDTSGFTEGDLVILTSDDTWLEVNSFNTQHGEYMIVDEILSSSKMRMKSATYEVYSLLNNARVHKVNPIKNITIDGITFKGRGRINGGEGDGDLGVGITYGQNIIVRNCAFIDIDWYQLEFRSCYDFLAERNYHFNSRYYSSSGGVGDKKPVTLTSRGTVQYQARTSDCCMYGTIKDCVGEGGRHFFNTGHAYRYNDGTSGQQTGMLFGINRHIKVQNCHSKNTWHAGFSTHGDAEFVEFIECTSENSGMAGFNPRSKQVKVIDCVTTNSKHGYLLSDYPQTVEIRGCKTVNCEGTVYMANINSNEATLDYKYITIEGNYFENSLQGIVIQVNSTALTGELNINNNIIVKSNMSGNYAPIRVIGKWDLTIEGNKIRETSGSGYQIRLEGVTRAIVQNNIIKKGYRLFHASSTCERVVVANNTFIEHAFGTIDNNSTTPTNQNNIIL